MRTAFVVGASSDIGLAVCRRYLKAGWNVIGHFRTKRAELEALANKGMEVWQADLGDTAALEKQLRDNAKFFQRADALINLAAAYQPRRFDDVMAADIMSTLTVNLVPGLLMMRSMGLAMAARGFGRIVHASSIGVTFGGGSESFCYALSKHALEFIPRACREWAARNVLVNVLRIGVTDTRFHAHQPGKDLQARAKLVPAGRAAKPAEIAEALYWFGSEMNGFATGQVTAIAGGE